jgi:hypothetical protein
MGTNSVGWAVGDGGTIVKTTDGGVTWSAQTSPATGRLWAVKAYDGSTAMATGDNGVVVRTTDGTNWNTMTSPTAEQLFTVDMTGQASAIVGGYASAWRTTDGGVTWTVSASVPSAVATFRHISMVDSLNGFAATSAQAIWKTVDGGANWTTAISVGGANVYTMSMADKLHGFAPAGNGGTLITTSDGWQTISSTTFNVWGAWGSVAADANTYISVAPASSWDYTVADAGANAQVTDYGSAPNNWAGAGNTNMFGVCLQAINGSTTAGPGWTVDGNNTCTAADSDPWKAVPTSVAKLAYAAGAGTTGRADVVWGFRSANNQTPGTYSATVVFEALAPNV